MPGRFALCSDKNKSVSLHGKNWKGFRIRRLNLVLTNEESDISVEVFVGSEMGG